MTTTIIEKLKPGLDWNELWKEAKGPTKFQWDSRQFWNQRAPEFARHAREGNYAEKFITLLQPRPEWTVLDIGCGAGTLALPLAQRVAEITALDISDRMLEILDERSRAQGITTIHTVRAGWEDDWEPLGVGVHDVVVASRSFYSDDLAAAIDKMQRLARVRVVMAALVADGPYDRKQYEAIGRYLDRGPDYIYILNYLHQCGIYARVQFIEEIEDKIYPDLIAALEGQRWMFPSMTPTEEVLLQQHLADRLVAREQGWGFPKPKKTYWAYLEWEPGEGIGRRC